MRSPQGKPHLTQKRLWTTQKSSIHSNWQVTKLVNEVYHMYNRHQYPFVALNIAVASGKPSCLSWIKRKSVSFLCTEWALPCCFIQSVWMWTSPRTNGRFSFRRRNSCWLLWRARWSTCTRLESIRSAWIICGYPLLVRNDQSHIPPHFVNAVHIVKLLRPY